MNRRQIEALQCAVTYAEHAQNVTLWAARGGLALLWSEYYRTCAERRASAPLTALQRYSNRG